MKGSESNPSADELHILVQYKLVAALQEREHDLAEAQRIAHLGSWSLDMVSGFLTWSDELYRLYGATKEDFPPSFEAFLSIIHPDDRPNVERIVRDAVLSGISFSLEHRLASNPDRWIRTRGEMDKNSDGVPIRQYGTSQEVASSSPEEITRCLTILGEASNADLVALYTPNGDARLTHIQRGKELGHLLESLVSATSWPQLRPNERTYVQDRILRVLQTPGAAAEFHYHPRLCSGAEKAFTARLLNATNVPALRGIVFFSHELPELAGNTHGSTPEKVDALTGLATYATLIEHSSDILAQAISHDLQCAFVAIDIDHFSDINRTLGQLGGDEVLVQVGRRLLAAFEVSSTGEALKTLSGSVARVGVDRFLVVCEYLPSPGIAELLAAQVRAVLRDPILVCGDISVAVTAQVGISFGTAGSPGVLDLIGEAEKSLTSSKHRRRDQLDTTSQNEITGLREAERFLRGALDRNEFTLYYQAKLSLESDRILGAEALLRWQNPTRGLVLPLEFIPLAEETGMIIPIGKWAIEEACRQVAEWEKRFSQLPPLVVSVNVSGRQFGPELVTIISEALLKSGAAPTQLCVEITESVLMEDAEAVGVILSQLADLGVKLSIDDFGTGYSSLSYLKHFPLHELKIDKSFVGGLGTDDHDTTIVAATVAMAHALGLSVTAEGVETEEQLERLRVIGCQEAQGYLIARPQPAIGMDRLLARWNAPGSLDGFPRKTEHVEDLYRFRRILVVDDAPDVRQLAKMTLSAVGFEVHEADDGAGAVLAALRILPDCVVLDAMMPDISGFAVCRALRDNPATAQATIVILTANVSAEDKIEAFSSGADDYIIKPFSPRDLVARVRAAMRRRIDAGFPHVKGVAAAGPPTAEETSSSEILHRP